MELKFTVDTDDLYDREDTDFQSMLTSALQAEIVKNCRAGLGSDQFKVFADLTSDTIVADIKLRMENFLSEDIALTEGWGKPTFVGSIEDLIKKRFDEVLLRPVDSSGVTLKGCTGSTKTWIEWKIESALNSRIKTEVESAKRGIERDLKNIVESKIVALKDGAMKKEVDAAFVRMLKP